jgi:hypothetical protein
LILLGAAKNKFCSQQIWSGAKSHHQEFIVPDVQLKPPPFDGVMLSIT